VIAKVFTSLTADHELVVYRFAIFPTEKGFNSFYGFQMGSVDVCGSASAFVSRVEMGEVGAEEDGGDGVEPIGPSDKRMFVPSSLAASMVGKSSNFLGQIRIVGGDRSSVSWGAEILGRIETECACRSESSHAFAVPACAVGLARVLDQMDLVGSGQVEKGFHLRGLSIEVDRNDGSSFWGHSGSGCRRVEGKGRGVDIRQDRLSSDRADRFGCCHEGEGGKDDFVTRSDFESPEDELKSRGSAVHTDGVAGFTVGTERFFESGNFRTSYESSTGEKVRNYGLQFGKKIPMLTRKIDQRDAL
jgi:hypothetical protein